MNKNEEAQRRTASTSADKSSGKTIAGVKTTIHAHQSSHRPTEPDDHTEPAQKESNREDAYGHRRGRLESTGNSTQIDGQHYSVRGSREGIGDPTFENEGAVSLDQPLEEEASEAKADYDKMMFGKDSVEAPEPANDFEGEGVATNKAFGDPDRTEKNRRGNRSKPKTS